MTMRRWVWTILLAATAASLAQAPVPRSPRQARSGTRRGPWPDPAKVEKTIRQFARDHLPAFVDEKLTALKQDKPQTYRMWLGRLSAIHMQHLRLKGASPKLAAAGLAESSLRLEVEYVAARCRGAESDQRAGLREQVWDIAGKLFDASQNRRRLQLADFQKRLERIRSSLKKREADRADIVAKFIEGVLAPPTWPASRPMRRPTSRPARRPMGWPTSRPTTGRGPGGPSAIQRPGFQFQQDRDPQRAALLSERQESEPARRWQRPRTEWRGTPRRMLLHRVYPQLAKVFEEQNRLMRKARELGRKYRRAPEADRPAIKAELKTIAEKWFEASGKRTAFEARRIEKQLERIKTDIDRRQRLRDQILLKYVGSLLLEDTPEM